MADPITKALEKLHAKECTHFKKILVDIEERNIGSYDVKRLVGGKDIFRLRKGKYRILFKMNEKEISILALEKRSDHTY